MFIIAGQVRITAVAAVALGILASICRKDRHIQISPFQWFYILAVTGSLS